MNEDPRFSEYSFDPNQCEWIWGPGGPWHIVNISYTWCRELYTGPSTIGVLRWGAPTDGPLCQTCMTACDTARLKLAARNLLEGLK